MRVFLLHRDRDFAIKPELRDPIFDAMVGSSGNPFAVENAKRNLERERAKNPHPRPGPPTLDEALAQDLELETLWRAMGGGDEFLFETAKRGTLSSLQDPDAIVYRQRVLADCLEHPEVVRRLYALALEGLAAERRAGSFRSGARPDLILHRSVHVLLLQVGTLRGLRVLAEEHGESFRSEGFTRFFTMLREELSDDYLQTVEHHLDELQFKRGLLETARLGKGLKGRCYSVRQERGRSWTERTFRGRRTSGFSFTIPPRDEAGMQALADLRARGINEVADALARSADHVESFLTLLRLELAFYLGCLNLHDALVEAGEAVCFPEPLRADEVSLVAGGLYDVCLGFHLEGRIVANDVEADGKRLVVITGANQGGKSTLLRSLGLAQLMLQAGMFVGARSFRANVCTGLYTHYKREEDAAMESGKLDEELQRMSEIARRLRPSCLLLLNESFASTNEREGSEIARQIVRALLERHVKVFFVTHLYDLARGFHAEGSEKSLFLRAERRPDGRRTFRIVPGGPEPTSYGADSFRRIFARAPGRTAGTDGEPVERRAASRVAQGRALRG